MKTVDNQHLRTMEDQNKDRGRLLISCPDRPGIVVEVSRFLLAHGANIVQSDQYSINPEGGRFFMRIEFDIPDLQDKETELEQGFVPIAEKWDMEWQFAYAYRLKRMAIFVSRLDHCLLELLWQWQAGDLFADIALIISNHQQTKGIAESFGIPFYYIPVSKDTKEQAEEEQLRIMKEQNIDLVVLARYMQILRPSFVEHYPQRIINIHHSFLPAFVGAQPYERAYERGVKIIGATSHYVTNELDEGPIIEQDVQRVNHRHNVQDLKRIGRHIEKIVLARAVSWHLEDKVIVHQNKTVVFV